MDGPVKAGVHLYCLCWNDARMLPHFFRHYDPIVDRYFVFDNGSTDGSLDLLAAHDRVTVAHFEVTGDSFVEEERRLSDTVWYGSRGQAQWVMMVDIDEFVFHPDLSEYLARCRETGVTALRGIGYEMVADVFPDLASPLVDTVTTGTRSAGHDKLCLFDPNALTTTGYQAGRHKAAPEGRVEWPERAEILLLHYKQLGIEYVTERSAELSRGLRDRDREEGWGRQYLWSAAEIRERWLKLRVDAKPVPGLGVLRDMDPSGFDQEHMIAVSGLFDSSWYLSSYPDIESEGADPLSHFCIHGWREGRRPNRFFHPRWYLETHADTPHDRNPLLHYIETGETQGLAPSAEFDPEAYRSRHGLDPGVSPLRHFLENGEVADATPPHTSAPVDELPRYQQLVSVLGFDPQDALEPMLVEPPALLECIKSLLRGVPVDETAYRLAYPDVEAAIAAGSLDSARTHFVEFGYFEGRDPSPARSDDTRGTIRYGARQGTPQR